MHARLAAGLDAVDGGFGGAAACEVHGPRPDLAVVDIYLPERIGTTFVLASRPAVAMRTAFPSSDY